ncbi:esterase/lipase family protein [Halocatena halophila]|uniref:esterase/lipase family protein n=1 Tax=Halocatena halophila TaxID=2814576 RepID=UPI002ED5FC65
MLRDSPNTESEETPRRTVNRRTVLQGMAGGAAIMSGLPLMSERATATVAEAQCLTAMSAPSDYPVVEKQEDLLGGSEFVEHGTFPQGADEVLIYVHGWLELFTGGAGDQGYTLQTALEQNGYTHPTITFKYPSNNPNWWGVQDAAEEDGRAFASWLEDYREQNPNTTVRMIGHSLGARTGLGCLDELVNENGHAPVRSFGMIGGAINQSAVTTDGEFGATIASGAEEVNNYYSKHDNILNEIFQLGQFGPEAVGAYGAPLFGDTPSNYYDHDVAESVKGHCLYYKPDKGCVPRIVANFPPGNQEGDDDWWPF